MVDVEECMTEAPSRILPFLRDSSVYIHALGLCRDCHNIGCGGEGFGLRVCCCAGRGIGWSFEMSGGGLRGVLVFELS